MAPCKSLGRLSSWLSLWQCPWLSLWQCPWLSLWQCRWRCPGQCPWRRSDRPVVPDNLLTGASGTRSSGRRKSPPWSSTVRTGAWSTARHSCPGRRLVVAEVAGEKGRTHTPIYHLKTNKKCILRKHAACCKTTIWGWGVPSSLFDAAGTFCTGRRWGGTRPTTFSDFNLLLLFSVEKSQTGVVLRLLRVAAVLVPGAGCRVPGAGCRVPVLLVRTTRRTRRSATRTMTSSQRSHLREILVGQRNCSPQYRQYRTDCSANFALLILLGCFCANCTRIFPANH
jgi:hypothetical protein